MGTGSRLGKRKQQEKVRSESLECQTRSRGLSASPLPRVRAPFLSPFLIPSYRRRLRCLEVGNHCLSDPSADVPLVSTPLHFSPHFFYVGPLIFPNQPLSRLPTPAPTKFHYPLGEPPSLGPFSLGHSPARRLGLAPLFPLARRMSEETSEISSAHKSDGIRTSNTAQCENPSETWLKLKFAILGYLYLIY